MPAEIGFTEALSMIVANQGDSQILFRVIGQGLSEALGPIAVQTYAGRIGKMNRPGNSGGSPAWERGWNHGKEANWI